MAETQGYKIEPVSCKLNIIPAPPSSTPTPLQLILRCQLLIFLIDLKVSRYLDLIMPGLVNNKGHEMDVTSDAIDEGESYHAIL